MFIALHCPFFTCKAGLSRRKYFPETSGQEKENGVIRRPLHPLNWKTWKTHSGRSFLIARNSPTMKKKAPAWRWRPLLFPAAKPVVLLHGNLNDLGIIGRDISSLPSYWI